MLTGGLKLFLSPLKKHILFTESVM